MENHNGILNSDPEGTDLSSAAMNTKAMKYTTQFSLSKMKMLLSKLTASQKAIVRKIGFGSLLFLDCTEYPKNLVFWLATKYDVKSQCVKLSEGASFRFNSFTVHQILGIPYGGEEVPTKSNAQANKFISSDIGQGVHGAKIDDLIALVNKDLDGDKFVTVFMLIVLSVFLFPSTNSQISSRYYSALVDVKDISKYNWSKEVSDVLHKKLKSFHESLVKGNKSRTASLGGCIFVLLASFFDYMPLPQTNVADSVPRIIVWNNKTMKEFESAMRDIDGIKIKSIQDTFFHSEMHAMSSNFRGFDLPDEISSQSMSILNTPHRHSSDKSLKLASSAKHGFEEVTSTALNERSVFKIMRESSESSLHVLCGEEFHPDVAAFINATIPGADKEDDRNHIKRMCQTFYKDSMQRYIRAMEPVLVKQSIDMIESYRQGLRQSIRPINPVQGAPFTYQKQHQVDATDSFDSAKLYNVPGKGLSADNSHVGTTVMQNKTETSTGNIVLDKLPQDNQHLHVMGSLISAELDSIDPKEGFSAGITHVDAKALQKAAETGVENIVVDNLIQDQKQGHAMVTDTPQVAEKVLQQEAEVSAEKFIDNLQRKPTTSHSPSASNGNVASTVKCLGTHQFQKHIANDAVEGMRDSRQTETNHGGTNGPGDVSSTQLHNGKSLETCTPPKRQHLPMTTMYGSPEKRMKTSSASSLNGDTNANNTSSGGASSPICLSKLELVRADKDLQHQTKLSSLLHRKHALKMPAPLATPSMDVSLPGDEVRVSDLEKRVFLFATRRGRDTKDGESPTIARIGRFYVNHREFGESLRPNRWIGTFLMDVYCEALNFDEKHSINQKMKKCFLTSDIVVKLKTYNVALDELKKIFAPHRIGFSFNEFDMVMIPTYHHLHWFLIVGNMRDKRYDVLSSLTIRSEDLAVTATIRTNYERVFQDMFGNESDINFSDFSIQPQSAPQQHTTHDCGVFVMKFLSWDGRRVSPVDNEQIYAHRQKLSSYIICHEANMDTLPELKKLIDKHQGKINAKGKVHGKA